MKIYGQDFRIVFGKLPWQYKVVVVLGAAFVLMMLVRVPYVFWQRAKDRLPEAVPLALPAAREASAVFDPAIAFDPASKKVWLAYTAKEPSGRGGGSAMFNIRLAGASAADGCKGWPVFAAGFDGKTDEILEPDGQTVFRSGIWRMETPALVHDPDDKGREWKLFAYRYFWPDDPAHAVAIAQHYSVISYKYTSDPSKAWSTEQWLFSAAPDYPPPPYEQMVLLHLNRLDPSLKDVTTYARPSAVYKDGALVMTLSAFTRETTPDRVVMIVSKDHGNSWLYTGVPLRQTDLAGITVEGEGKGLYTRLSGATLIEQEGKVYLAAVLGNEQMRGQGTFIFEFEDFAKGRLVRDTAGAPKLIRHIPLQNYGGNAGGGYAAYSDACAFGLLTTEQKGAFDFQILKTYVRPVEHEEED